MAEAKTQLRIGQGFDVHAFAVGRPLILGMVQIPYHLGLLGHSDADVLLHAVTDAVIGALALGDIGKWFPDSDPAFKGIASSKLLADVWNKCVSQGWSLVNCDCVIIAQEPKIAPYTETMSQELAKIFDCEAGCVNIKGKSTEHLGFIGRKEGIAASAVVLLEKREQ